MELIHKNKDNEKTIKFSVDEYEDLLKILNLSTLPEHRENLYPIKSKMWNELYDMDLV